MLKRLFVGIVDRARGGGLVAAGVVRRLHWLTFASAGAAQPRDGVQRARRRNGRRRLARGRQADLGEGSNT